MLLCGHAIRTATGKVYASCNREACGFVERRDGRIKPICRLHLDLLPFHWALAVWTFK